MKRINFILSAAALFFVAACAEKEPAINTLVERAVETLTICASMEEDADTKTVLDPNKNNGEVIWSNADYLYVFTKPTEAITKTRYVFSHKKNEDGTIIKGTFECKDWPIGAVPTYALFNRLSANAENPDELSDETIKIGYGHADDNIIAKLRDEQKVRNGHSFAGDANIAVGEVKNVEGNYSVDLKNLCGLIKFTMNEKPASVTLSGNNGEMIAGGRLRISFNDDGTPFWRMVGSDPGSKSVTLIDNNNLWDSNNENQYYICILPPIASKEGDAYYDSETNTGVFTKGITLTVKTADGETYTRVGKSALSVTRNEVVDLGKISKEDANTLVLDLPMTSEALPSDFPVAIGASKIGPKSYDFTINGETYSFEFNADGRKTEDGTPTNNSATAGKTGFAYNTKYNYYSLGYTYGYIKFPAIDGMRLFSVSVFVANATKSIYDSTNETIAETNPVKQCTIRETPSGKVDSGKMVSDIDDSKAVHLAQENNSSPDKNWIGPNYVWTFADDNSTKSGTSYYFQSRNGSVKLGKLQLIYVSAE